MIHAALMRLPDQEDPRQSRAKTLSDQFGSCCTNKQSLLHSWTLCVVRVLGTNGNSNLSDVIASNAQTALMSLFMSELSACGSKWLRDKGMKHSRGAPYHPQTQGKIERRQLCAHHCHSDGARR